MLLILHFPNDQSYQYFFHIIISFNNFLILIIRLKF